MLTGNCRHLSKDNPFATAVLASLEQLTPEERSDYRTVRRVSLSAIEQARPQLMPSDSPDELMLNKERYMRDQIEELTHE